MSGATTIQSTFSGKRRQQAIGLLGLAAAAFSATGCRQDMHNQPKFYPQRSTSFYSDGRSVRPQVENTVARNQLHQNAYFYTGLVDGKEGDGMPLPVTMELLQRGQERYNIFCTPCHSRVGNGAGMIVQRGYRPAGNFHTDRLRNAPLGHFYSVIANGYGAMPEYASQIATEDRWAIVAYIRALQLSQAAKPADVPAGQHPQDLHEIASQQAMPPGFADPWALPATAVYGTPNNQDNGIPGLGSNAPSTGANAHGSAAATMNSGTRNSGGPLPAGDSQAPGSLAGERAH
ncbi:MAG TPA: cytochrome c [Acidobacteriaceae bacterium]|nr:cytochrome c [Acidobacteriaceae bacterium]